MTNIADGVSYAFQLDTDHFQFYVEDLAIAHDTSTLWDDTDDPLLQSRDGLLAVGTARWGASTTVIVEVHITPTQEAAGWEQCRAAQVRTRSGTMHLTTPEGGVDQAASFLIAPGLYHVRVYYGHLSGVEDELASRGPDWYKLIFWPVL